MVDGKGPLVVVLLALLACNSTSKPAEEPAGAAPSSGTYAAAPVTTTEYTPTPSPTATSEPVDSSNAPEISRSTGAAGGAIVLWPRIVLPRGAGKPDPDTRAWAAKIQARLVDIARRVMPGKSVEVRPEPERVCPKQGCSAISLGILLARAGGGCSAFALISGPGTSAARIVPWSPGRVKLSSTSVAFREPAEKNVKVEDYATCAKLPEDLAGKDADVEAAIRAVAGP
jgi:hypothetical protein